MGWFRKRFGDAFDIQGGSMRSTLLACAIASLVCLFSVHPAAHAQGTGTSGEIRGTVTDAAGGTVPKATVEVTDPEKGISRNVVTESNGLYEGAGLPPSAYTVTVQASGFQTETHKNVVLHVGQTLVLDLHRKGAE